MAYKDLGPNVSQKPQAVVPGGGQYTAEDHSFEQVVFEFNRPIADWELNLQGEITGASGIRLLTQKTIPSCFLTGDFAETADGSGSYLFYAPDPPLATTANKFRLRGADLAVNGWMVRLDFTDSATAGMNVLTIPAPPAGINTTRTDFLFLEVWRALVSPGTSDNKSPTGQVLRHGNAKAADSFPPGNENLVDDLLDPTFLTETTRRVQIQYRYRIVSGIDLTAFPDGLDSPALFANTVPYLFASPVDGAVTAFNYVKAPNDPGLWVAGSGTPASSVALGTVDGYMYAIPVCAVFRRNSAAFDRDTNVNGAGLMATGVSGRPDGLYADQVVGPDVLDMRKSVSSGWEEALEKAVQQLFDNSLSTKQEVTSTGPSGTSVFAKEDVGPGHFGQPDGVRRYFSDRSNVQPVVAKVDVVGATTTVSFSLSALKLSWDTTPINVLSLSPPGTQLLHVAQVRIVDTAANTDHRALSPVTPFVKAIDFHVAVGPAIDEVTLTFDVAIASVTVYAELWIEYPPGNGTVRNLLSPHELWVSPVGAPAWIDQTGWTATSDPDRSSVPDTGTWWADPGHRELQLRFTTTSQTNTFYTAETDILFVWEELNGQSVLITDGLNAPYMSTNYLSSAYSVIILTGGISVPAGSPVSVTYVAFRSPPQLAAAPFDSFQLFYQSRAVQSVPVPAGSQTLQLVPRSISKSAYVITNGSGSPDSAVPFQAPSCQVPVGTLPPGSYPESRLDSPSTVALPGFSLSSGFAQLIAHVPYAPNPALVTLHSDGPDVTVDGDGRNFWPKSDDGSVPVYTPSVIATPLAGKQRHKIVLPTLMELKQDTVVGRRGSLLLVVFTRWAEFDDQDSISLTSVLGDSCAAVFRVRGNLLNPKRGDV